MKKVEIECKGISEIRPRSGGCINMELLEVDMSFLEQVSAADIIKGCDLKELLKAIDYDTLVDYLEEKYDIEKIKVRR